jgi:hypothetical protein
MLQKEYLAVPVSLALAAFGAAPALAQTTIACDDATTLPNAVFLAGSSAFEPTLMQLAVTLKAKQNVSIIYQPISSCSGVADIENGTALTGNGDYFLTDSTGKATKSSCVVPPGTIPLVGVSDVFYDSCNPGVAMPATLGHFAGPQQAMLIVVPEANVTTTALSWQQAAAIFGCGAKGLQTPFVDETAIEVRKSTSGTQTMIGAAIGVPPTAFKGVANNGTSDVINGLLALANPQIGIGIAAADAYDPARDRLNSVAFQGMNQTKAYYADSTATALDKANVRDGHYAIQGPTHFFAALTGGQPSAQAKRVLDWITGAAPIDPTGDPTNRSYVATVAAAGSVPPCAMKVQISKDGGLFAPYTPPVSCNCFFDKTVNKLTTDPPGCVACAADSQCTGGKRCQTGYCE